MNKKQTAIQLNQNKQNHSAWLFILVSLYVTFNLIGNALVFKIIKLGPALGVGGTLIMPLIYLIEDVIAEVYGYKISRLLIWAVLLSECIFSIAVLLIIRIPSPVFWHHQASFNTVFNPIMQVGPIAILAVLIGRFTNIYLITRSKVLVLGKYFWARSVFSTCVGGAIVGILYFYVGFWGRVPLASLNTLFLSDFLIRVAYAVFGGIPAFIFVDFLKKVDKIDVYDFNTNFNPFKINLNDEDE